MPVDLAKYGITLEEEPQVDLSRYGITVTREPGDAPDNPLQEQHPEADRMAWRLLAPQDALRYYRQQGFEAEPLGTNLALRRPGEPWRVIDPGTGFFSSDFFSDVADVAADLPAAIGSGIGMTTAGAAAAPSGPGALAAAAGGGAVGGAAGELVKQAAADMLGYGVSAEGLARRVSTEAAYGAAAPFLGKAVDKGVGAVKGIFRRAPDLARLSDDELRAAASQAGLKGVDRFSREDLIERIVTHPGRRSPEQAMKEAGKIKARYFKGTEDYHGKFTPSIKAQRLEGLGEEASIEFSKRLRHIAGAVREQLQEHLPGDLPPLDLDDPAAIMRALTPLERQVLQNAFPEVYQQALVATRKRIVSGVEREAAEEMADVRARALTREGLEAADEAELQRVARLLGIPERAPRGELLRGLSSTPGTRAKAAVGQGLMRTGKALRAPNQAMVRGVHGLVEGRAGKGLRQAIYAERDRAIQGLSRFSDDVLSGVSPDDLVKGFNPATATEGEQAFARELVRVRDYLSEGVDLTGKEHQDLWQSLFEAYKRTPSYLARQSEINTGNAFRKMLRRQYGVPPEERMLGAESLAQNLFTRFATQNPAFTLAATGWWMPHGMAPVFGGVAAADIAGRGITRLGRRMMTSVDPVAQLAQSPSAPGRIRQLAQAAFERWNRQDREGYRAAVYVLLTKPETRRWLESSSEEGETAGVR